MAGVGKPELVWEDPPPAAKRGETRGHDAIARLLEKRPGEWAIIFLYETAAGASTMAAYIRSARIVAYEPKGFFEAHARTVEGEHRVYARYVGEE